LSAAYDYLFLTLAGGRPPHPALAEQLRDATGARLAGHGGQIVGQFAPQLGWANDEAAVLVRWTASEQPGDAVAAIASPLVTGSRAHRLSPTLRPADDDLPAGGGIYVHRWFEVEAASVEAFVRLSGEGWKGFEAQFDARIFGLFRAELDARDRAESLVRLLLLTRYGDHEAWEASRDPTTEAMQIFLRRQQLTRRTWAASTRLVSAP
jgi:hypothetical protein